MGGKTRSHKKKYHKSRKAKADQWRPADGALGQLDTRIHETGDSSDHEPEPMPMELGHDPPVQCSPSVESPTRLHYEPMDVDDPPPAFPPPTPPSALAPVLQKKASQPSLPTGSQAGDRPESRASTGADDSLLAERMTITTSLTVDTHEKVETKNSPRHILHVTEPKRKSEVAAESELKGLEDELVPLLPGASAESFAPATQKSRKYVRTFQCVS